MDVARISILTFSSSCRKGYGAGCGMLFCSETFTHNLFLENHRRESLGMFFWNLGNRHEVRHTLMGSASITLDIFGGSRTV